MRPIFVRSSFRLDVRRTRDPLRLRARVDEALRAEASRGREAPLVYIDAAEAVDAYFVSGLYAIENGAVQPPDVLGVRLDRRVAGADDLRARERHRRPARADDQDDVAPRLGRRLALREAMPT